MSENLRKLLSSSEMTSISKSGSRKDTGSSSIKWIPIDNKRMIDSKLPDPAHRQKDKSDSGRQADLKVFEVRFPTTSSSQKEAKVNKPVTFQLIPLKSLPCVNVDAASKKNKASSDAPDESKFGPTKKLRTGIQNARPNANQSSTCFSNDRYLLDRSHLTGCCNIDSDEEMTPNGNSFNFYQQYEDEGISAIPMDITGGEMEETEDNIDYWFDQFSRSLCTNQKAASDHRVPEFASTGYDELERLITSISKEPRKDLPSCAEPKQKSNSENKENTIFVKKKKRPAPPRTTCDNTPVFKNKLNLRGFIPKPRYDEEELKGKLSVKTKNELDIYTKTMNVPKSEFSTEKILGRRKTIHTKLRQSGHLRFTPVEEYDIHQRAEIFMESVVPDKNYYLANDKEEQLKAFVDSVPPPRKRRKHFTIVDDMLVMAPYNRPGYDSYITLENGTRLLRPPTKLVELVAKAINDSPDCMLQVHQVYTVLQKRFPYFQYMDKGYLTSWRSSIRHALYQKWFRKVQFSAEVINNKGCYWAINRKFTPKEWNLPPKRQEHSSLESLSKRDVEVLQEMDTFDAVSPVIDILEEPLVDDRLSGLGTPSMWDPLLGLESATTSTRCTAAATPSYSAGNSRDPDPMLNLPNARAMQTATPDPFEDPIVIAPDDNSQGTEQLTQKSDDSGYFGNLLWSPLDKLALDLDPLSCLSPHHTSSIGGGGDSSSAAAAACVEDALTLEQLLKASSPKLLTGMNL